MVSRDYQALSARRRARASELAERYPAAGEVLRFHAELVQFQSEIFPRLPGLRREELVRFRERLFEVVERRGTARLREAAASLDEETLGRAIAEYWQGGDAGSIESFFARALLQPFAAAADFPPAAGGEGRGCPRCNHRPQVGALRPQGEGSALYLVCSLCLDEWAFRRGVCAGCGEESEGSMAYYSAPGFEHIRLQACERCGLYLHTVDLAEDGDAVPEVDELAALPLDVWAREQGYRKLHPNLAGI